MSEKYINLSVEFTNTYKKYMDAAPQIREAMCLKSLYPAGFKPLRKNDIFAGRVDVDPASSFINLPVVFNPKKESQVAYFCSIPTLLYFAEEYPHRKAEIDEIIEFWKKESTFVKIIDRADDELKDYLLPYMTGRDEHGYMKKGIGKKPLGSGFISGSFDTRAAGIIADFRKVCRLGIDGLFAEIDRLENKNGKNDFYAAARLNIELVRDTLEHYRAQAEELIKDATGAEKENLEKLEKILKDLQTRAPQTFREAIQFSLMFIIIAGLDNFGRFDVYFGDYLANDLKNGTIDEEEAITYIMSLWNFAYENCGAYDARVIIGGMGRENEENADTFALLAMEATRRLHITKPVLTLRLYNGQNPALYEKALDCISEGCIYPTLYNDEVCVPGFMKSMDMPFEDAVDYIPIGCGEVVIAGKSMGSPNSTFRMLKALEAALHNGRDGVTPNLVGIQTGELDTLDTFDKLYNAFLAQLDARLRIDNKVHAHYKKITAEEAGFVLASILMDDCLEKGADMFHGGIRYFGCNLEGFGLTNTINSLAVIKKYVYDEKKYTLEELVHMLDVNFEGYEEERKLFMAVDKFGNNKPWVDDLKLSIEAFLNERASKYAKENGLHYCTVASVNPGGITIGPATAASADGRLCGEPFALANSPMPGTDVSGLTAMLLSTAKADAANGGYVTNMNISRETIVKDREKVSSLFKTYFEIGGQQLNINCFSRGDLEKALEEPEKYRHIIVRVSGYSARFVDLDPITQKHIMERTLY